MLEPNITVHGATANSGITHSPFGPANGALINDGTFDADASGSGITINCAAFTNNGTGEADNGDTLIVNPTTFGNFSAGVLTAGAWKATSGGILRLLGDAITTNAASILLDGATSRIYSDVFNTNALAGFSSNTAAGSVTIQNGASFSATQAFTNAGAVTIGSNSLFTLGGNEYVQAGGTTVLAAGQCWRL